jgi:nickel/cobalt transporter (NicO) family protein
LLKIILKIASCTTYSIKTRPAKSNNIHLLIVVAVLGTITIATMLAAVLVSRAGINLIPLTKVQHYSHAIAGASIFLCGLAITFLGL